MNQYKLVLASSSPYRQQLLRQLRLAFLAESPALDETPREGEQPRQLALRLAEEKAHHIFRRHPYSVVIGSDQVADLDGQILGKPHDEERAFAQLRTCSGKTLVFHTGLAVVAPGKTESVVVATQVKFRQLTDLQIRAYIKKEAAFDCAGSFKCEGLGIALFEQVYSSDPSALIGLPLISLTQLLQRVGIDPLTE